MNPLVFLVLDAVQSLIKLRDTAELAALKAEVQQLIDKLTPQLPVKADGSPWTDADVQIAAARARSVFDLVKG